MKFWQNFATLGRLGYLSPAPGTIGSLAALPLAYILIGIGGVWLLTIAILVVAYFGTRAIRIMIAEKTVKDPQEVIIDEVVGQWIALWPVAYGMFHIGLDSWTFLWPGYVTAFIAFRAFDIRKPWLAGRADRRGDAFGVMLDDIWAGVFAAVVVVILSIIYHVLFLI